MSVNPTELALQRSLSDVVAEYDHKLAAIPAALAAFHQAGNDLKTASTIAGVYGDVSIDVGHVHEQTLTTCLLKSAWKHVYDGLNMDRLASPLDKQRWKQSLEKPEPFTLDNIRSTFGKYIVDPRGSILRALAEVFCSLDPAYKSHDKVRIGVKGLPKRIVLSNVSNYSSYGRDKLESLLNALAAYQGKPLVTYRELLALLDDEHALLNDNELPPERYQTEPLKIVGRGVRLRRFANGNGHLFFEANALRDINRALAEFYGDVLPDTTEEKPDKPRPGTAVSKDLQYYPTPIAVVDDVLDHVYLREGESVLEPSCGCGRILDGLRKRKAVVYGIEVDFARAAQARAKGHAVLHANFLETAPTPEFDHVVMNPPFYGKHYAKHVRHAFGFLKPGGTLTAILPFTAKEHGLLDDLIPKPGRWDTLSVWRDLPVGSFSESGTNINTVVLRIRKPD